MLRQNHKKSKSLRFLISVLCALLYLCAATPILALGTALVAWVDGEHTVQLNISAEMTRVVLGHDGTEARTAPTHAHCLTVDTLLLLAEPPVPLQSEHVLNFQGISATAKVLRDVNRYLESSSWEVPAPSELAVILLLPPPAIHARAPMLAFLPPDWHSWMIRSTVLVI